MDGSSYAKIPLTLTCHGSYGQVRRFIQELARLQRAFKVSDLRLRSFRSSQSVSRKEEQILDVTISLVVYVVPKGGDR